MQRKTILFVLLLFGVLVLALPVSAQDESITIWLTGSDNEAVALQAVGDAFAEQTGISVTVEAVPWGDSYTRSLTAVNSGSGADIVMGGMSWGISLGGVGGLVNLQETFGDELTSLLEANNTAFVDAIIGIDGNVYAVPFSQDVYVMYYLPAALEEAGVEVPTTWEEFTAVLDALEEAGLGGAGYGWGTGTWLNFQNYLYQAGGKWYEDDCSAAAINSDEALTALEYYTTLYEDYDFPAEELEPGASFSTGEYSIVISGEWHAPGIDASFPELEDQWAIAPLPAGPTGENPVFIGGRMAGIFSFSPNQDAAWQFLEYLTTPEAAEILASENFDLGSLFLPPQPDNGQFIRGGDMVNAVLNEQLASVTAPPNCPGWEETNAEVNLLLQSVIYEGANFEDALADMEDIMNAGLEEYGG